MTSRLFGTVLPYMPPTTRSARQDRRLVFDTSQDRLLGETDVPGPIGFLNPVSWSCRLAAAPRHPAVATIVALVCPKVTTPMAFECAKSVVPRRTAIGFLPTRFFWSWTATRSGIRCLSDRSPEWTVGGCDPYWLGPPCRCSPYGSDLLRSARQDRRFVFDTSQAGCSRDHLPGAARLLNTMFDSIPIDLPNCLAVSRAGP